MNKNWHLFFTVLSVKHVRPKCQHNMHNSNLAPWNAISLWDPKGIQDEISRGFISGELISYGLSTVLRNMLCLPQHNLFIDRVCWIYLVRFPNQTIEDNHDILLLPKKKHQFICVICNWNWCKYANINLSAFQSQLCKISIVENEYND